MARVWIALRDAVPADVRIPGWVSGAITGALIGGTVLGLSTRGASLQRRMIRATFFSAAFGYLVTSLVDFAEHFRLEKEATGHYLRATVVPPGETLNHAATLATVITSLALVGRGPRSLSRQIWAAIAPALFLALGWRDELVYHRKRSSHREDMMHTVPHLAAGVMWTTLYPMRLLS